MYYQAVFICLLITSTLYELTASHKYEPNWDSLDKRPLPSWYDEAKVGIFIHWGVYSVPSFGSEWFWQNWRNVRNPDYINYMKQNYKPNFSYQDFAKDFTAELFNATQWAELFRDSGARYVVLTSKHHDGFTLWPSKESFSWNAMDVGPKRDIIRELSAAVREHRELKFGVYYSLYEWFNRMYIDDKLHIFLQQNYVERKMWPELKELVTNYLPEVIWSDGDWEAPAEYWKSEEFIAWLYNDSPVSDTVVTNDRWGINTDCQHGDFYNCGDRFNPGALKLHKWENAFTLDKTSWGQRFDSTLSSFMTTAELIEQIVRTVSCNGNALINIIPTKYGTILPIFEERLRDMGHWLKINGKAIYASKPWLYQNDSITSGVWYTCKENTTKSVIVYAIILEYPYETNTIDLYPLGKQQQGYANILLTGLEDLAYDSKPVAIKLLGMESAQIKWTFQDNSIRVIMPPKNHIDKAGLDLAWTLEIKINK